MKSISLIKWMYGLLPFTFLVLLALRIAINEPIFTRIGIIICLAGIGIYMLLFKKQLFISLLVFLIPLSINTNLLGGSSVSAPSEFMVALMGLTVTGIAISKPTFNKKILFHPITLLLVVDLLWMIISSFYSEMYMYSAKRILVRMMYLMVFYLLMTQWFTDIRNMVKFFLLYSCGLIFPIIATEIKHARYEFDPRTVFELCKPYFSDHTIFGACIAYVIPFLIIVAINYKKFGLAKYLGWGIWGMLIILVIGEFFAFSRAAWLSLAVSLLFFLLLKLKLRFIHFLFVLIAAITLVISFQDVIYDKAKRSEKVSNKGELTEHIMSVGNLNTDASNLERLNRWNSAFRMYQDRPITGFGPGTYQFVYGPYQSVYEMTYISTMAGDRGNAHSEPLTYLSETGLPGFISYIVWTLATIGFGIRAYYRSKDEVIKSMILAALLGFITFYFHGLVNSFIDQVKMASLVFTSLAVITIADIYAKSNPSTYETQKTC